MKPLSEKVMNLKRKRIMNLLAAAICLLVLIGISKLFVTMIYNSPYFVGTILNIKLVDWFSLVIAAIVQSLLMWVFYKYVVGCDVTVGKCFKCVFIGTVAIFTIIEGIGYFELIILSRMNDITKEYNIIFLVNTIIRAIIYLIVTGSIGITPEEKEFIQRQQEEYRKNNKTYQ